MEENIIKVAKEISNSCNQILGNLNQIKDEILIPSMDKFTPKEMALFTEQAEKEIEGMTEGKLKDKFKNFVSNVDFSKE